MIAEFERARIQERVVAGLARAKAQGRKLGRPEREIRAEQIARVRGLPVREAARRLGDSTLDPPAAGPNTCRIDLLISSGNGAALATCRSGPQPVPWGPYSFSGAGGASLL